jgi:hypothetical protein
LTQLDHLVKSADEQYLLHTQSVFML